MSATEDSDMPVAVEQPDISGAKPMECDVEVRFIECCKVKLSLDENYVRHATELFRETQSFMVEGSIGFDEECERHWTAGLLYVLKRMEKRDPPGFTLAQILEMTNLPIIDFFRELPHFLTKCDSTLKRIYGDDWLKRLQVKEDQASLVHLMILFKFYKRLYSDYFACSEGEEIPVHMRFGWILFLVVRTRVLGQFPDLVTSTHTILAIFAILVVHMPTSLRKFALEDDSFFPKRDSEGVDLVASFSQNENASEEDVKHLLEKVQSSIADVFQGIARNATSDVPQLSGLRTARLLYFEGLMDDKTLPENLRVLEELYVESYSHRGAFDERICMITEEGGPDILCTSQQRFSSSQNTGSQPISSPSGSPCSSPVKTSATPNKLPPTTPVSITMTTAKWLRTVIAPLPAEPTAALLSFFKACDRDITDEVVYRAKVLLDGIFPSQPRGSWKVLTGSMDSVWAEQRRLEALKLYYRVLCSMCRYESQRLQISNLTSLLTNEKFHRCMIACSAELVLATHKTVIMTFPAVLEPTGITAFDLSKVIESFVRNEETLPRELKRHLNSIEERLLESMAWEKGSSMYNSLIVAKPKLGAEIMRLNMMAEPMPSLDTLAPHQGIGKPEQVPDAIPSSPERESMITSERGDSTTLISPASERPSAFSAFASVKRNMSQLQSVFASPQRPNPQAGGETCAETVISVFFQKVLKLAAIRIKSMCERLQQPGQVIEQIYRVVQFALHNVTNVFFNRHIDQIILCSVYGVCKVLKLSVTFRGIICQYRKQPQCKNHVFRNVFLDHRRGRGHDTGDIIKFYNDYFVPATKSFLINLAPNAPQPPPPGRRDGPERTDNDPSQAVAGPGSPKPSTAFPSLPDMSPKKVSAKHNVFVSPLRNTKVENIMSPHSRSLYACVGESTHAYQSPSKDLTAINNRLNNRRFGRLDFDEASLVSDSFVAGDFCPRVPNANGHPRPASDVNESSPQSPQAKRQKLDR